MDKNYVKMATHVCPVCGVHHKDDTEILLDRRLKEIKGDPVTGYGLCKEHKDLFEDGYIALVVADPKLSDMSDDDSLKIENAYRTGEVAHMKREAFEANFETKVPETQEMAYIDPEVFKIIQEAASNDN